MICLLLPLDSAYIRGKRDKNYNYYVIKEMGQLTKNKRYVKYVHVKIKQTPSVNIKVRTKSISYSTDKKFPQF